MSTAPDRVVLLLVIAQAVPHAVFTVEGPVEYTALDGARAVVYLRSRDLYVLRSMERTGFVRSVDVEGAVAYALTDRGRLHVDRLRAQATAGQVTKVEIQ